LKNLPLELVETEQEIKIAPLLDRLRHILVFIQNVCCYSLWTSLEGIFVTIASKFGSVAGPSYLGFIDSWSLKAKITSQWGLDQTESVQAFFGNSSENKN